MPQPEARHPARPSHADSGTANSPAYFDDALRDAERLLKYAAEIGVDVDPSTRDAILTARAARGEGWNQDVAANLLAALTWLAARLKPVTADSLQAYHNDTRVTVRNYLRIAMVIACIIVPVSIMSFVASALSNDLTHDIETANKLAVQLRAQLGAAPPPPAPVAVTGAPVGAAAGGKHAAETVVVTQPVQPAAVGPNYPPGINQAEIVQELQEYASTTRVIYDRSRKLNLLVLHSEKDPFKYSETKSPERARRQDFEVTPGLPNFYEDRDRLTSTYQQVRNFAQNLITDEAVAYGAITSCILPVLYALLGTCAYLLRTFEDQMNSRTFTPSVANSARFVIAAIGGAVVGLFNNFAISTQASLSPLALAFLVGYAVDVFFTFLEGLLKAFSKAAPGALPPPPSSVVKP
jgi:hypothetical protein